MSTPPPLPERPRLPWDPPDHFEKRIPDGDNRERLVCARCEFIHYQNPKIVAGAVCTWNDRILLAKRAIEPRKGFWTLPAGYMELGETTEQAAQHDARGKTDFATYSNPTGDLARMWPPRKPASV